MNTPKYNSAYYAKNKASIAARRHSPEFLASRRNDRARKDRQNELARAKRRARGLKREPRIIDQYSGIPSADKRFRLRQYDRGLCINSCGRKADGLCAGCKKKSSERQQIYRRKKQKQKEIQNELLHAA